MMEMLVPDETGIILATVAVLLSLCYVTTRRKPERFPPGPSGLPFVGYAPFLGENPGKTMSDLSRKYGPVFSVTLGNDTWVMLNDYETIQEALVKHSRIFSGRPKIHMFQKLSEGKGIVFKDYDETFKGLRKFGVKALKRFGLGKSSTEAFIIEELSYMCGAIGSNGGKSFYCQPIVSNAIANIILRVVMGTRLAYDSERFVELVTVSNKSITDKLDGALFGVMTFVPLTRFLPVFWGSYNRFFANLKIINGILEDIINEHKASFHADNIRDFIDEFLKEMEVEENEIFHHRQLVLYFHDLFVAGMETTSSTLRWCLLALLHFNESQEKIWKEIEQVIGGSGIPSMKHQDQMQYTCAFIHEVMRHRTLVPLNLPHKANCDITLGDYDIPKDTPIMPNLWAVHHDPNFFPNPEEFRPERFIDDNNCFVPSPHVIPFSVGPRSCLGEQLARMEIFLFLVGILQKFKIVPDPEKPLPAFDKGVFGVVYGPLEFDAIFQQR